MCLECCCCAAAAHTTPSRAFRALDAHPASQRRLRPQEFLPASCHQQLWCDSPAGCRHPARCSSQMAPCSSWWCPTRSFASIRGCSRNFCLRPCGLREHRRRLLHLSPHCTSLKIVSIHWPATLLTASGCQFTRIAQASRVVGIDSILRCADGHFLSGAPRRGPRSAQSDSTDS